MSEHYRQHLRRLQSLLEPGLRRMLLISFVLHLIIPVILSGVLKITHKTPKLPVYRVNLVNKPVKNPQAGRPDAAPIKKKKKKKKSVKKKLAAKKVVAKKTSKVKTVPVKKKQPPVQKLKAPAKKLKADKSAQKALKDRLAEMQAKAERQARLDKLRAALAAQQADLGRRDVQAPVGEPDGTGDEIGNSALRYIKGFIAEQWRLSPYQSPLDLEAEVRVTYSAAGKQGYWKIKKESGNVFFDDSVKRAIIRSKDLGYPLPSAGTFDIVFNLKDLQK